MKWPRWLVSSALLAVASAVPPALAVETDDANALLDDNTDVAGTEASAYGRLRHMEGSVTARRDGMILEGLSENEPVAPGDDITTGPDGRVEIQLADGSSLKLDHASRLILQSLPDGSAEMGDTTILQLIEGSLLFTTQGMDSTGKRFQVDTAGASIFPLSNGQFRVDMRPGGTTSFSSRRGAAETTARDVSVLVRSGQRLSVRPGQQPSDPQVFNTRLADDFDLWSDDVDSAMDRRRRVDEVAPAGLPDPVQPYVNELSYYGRWSHYPSYGWVWRPVGVVANWQPYAYGRWTRCPSGLVWVGSEPWGWAPYHYGRWEFLIGTGWAWIPGSVFSGAYVSWSVAPGYFGWCPLGFYNYPVAYGFGYGVGSPWIYVNSHDIFERRVNTVIIRNVTVVKEIQHRCVVVRRPPRIDDRRPDTAPHVAEELHRVFSRQSPRPEPEEPAARRTPFREQERARAAKLNTMRRAAQIPEGTAVPRQTAMPIRQPALRPGEVEEGRVWPSSSRGITARPVSTGGVRQSVQQVPQRVPPGQMPKQDPKQDQDSLRVQQPQSETPRTVQSPPRAIPRIIPNRRPAEELIYERERQQQPAVVQNNAPPSSTKPPQAGRGQPKPRQQPQQKPKQDGSDKDKHKDKN